MATFDLDSFLLEPTVELLSSCRRADLLAIAEHFDVKLSKSLKKSVLFKKVISFLVDMGVLGSVESAVADPSSESGSEAEEEEGEVGMEESLSALMAEAPAGVPGPSVKVGEAAVSASLPEVSDHVAVRLALIQREA